MSWWWRILAGVALLGLLAWAWPAGAARQDVRDALLTVRLRAHGVPIWVWLLLGWLWTLSYVVRAERLYVEWHTRTGLTRAACLRLVLRHFALLNLLPMRAGEVALPILLNRERGVPLSEGAGSLLWWRWQDIVVLAGLASALILPRWGSGWAMGGSALCLLAAVASGSWVKRLQMGRVGRWPRIARLAAAAAEPARRPSTWALCVLAWAVKLTALGWAMTLLTGTDWTVGLLAAAGGEWGAAWPVQPLAGFGSVELAAWGAVSVWHPTASPLNVMAASLFLHLITLLLSTVMGTMACWATPSASTFPSTESALGMRPGAGTAS